MSDPHSENVDERGVRCGSHVEVQKGRGRMQARSDPKVPAEQQWEQ